MEKIRNNKLTCGSGGCAAFTLVEILVVVVILAIAMVMAVPMFSSAGSVQVDSAANMIASDIEYARSMAITRQQSYGIIFDQAGGSYEVVDHNGTVIEHPVKGGSDYAIDFSSQRSLSQVAITEVDIDGGAEIKFDYLGAPFNSGDTAMTAGTITIGAGEITRTILIEPVTGYVKIN